MKTSTRFQSPPVGRGEDILYSNNHHGFPHEQGLGKASGTNTHKLPNQLAVTKDKNKSWDVLQIPLVARESSDLLRVVVEHLDVQQRLDGLL